MRRIALYGTQELTPRHARAYPTGYYAYELPERKNCVETFLGWMGSRLWKSEGPSAAEQRLTLRNMIRNPAETLLNTNFDVNDEGRLSDPLQRSALKRIGVQLFWIAVEQSDEEVEASLTLFPHRCECIIKSPLLGGL